MGLLGKTLKGRSTNKENDNGPYHNKNIREKVLALTLEEQQKRSEEEKKKLAFFNENVKEEMALLLRNVQKVRQNWQQILESIKSEELKRTLEAEAVAFWRELENHDLFIQQSHKRLVECAEQRQAALRAHFVHLDRLTSVNVDKLNIVRRDFSEVLVLLKEEFTAEECEINGGFNDKVSSQETVHPRPHAADREGGDRQRGDDEGALPADEGGNQGQNGRRN